MRKKLLGLVALLACCAVVAGGLFAAGIDPRYLFVPDPRVSLSSEMHILGSKALTYRFPELSSYSIESVNDAYHLEALLHVIPMEYESRENVAFGPWEAVDDFGAKEANDDGLITEWEEGYYITHDWSEYGQQIRQMIPGDTLAIDGMNLVVAEIFDYPRVAYLEQIYEVSGHDAIVLQTCETGTENNRIVVCTHQ